MACVLYQGKNSAVYSFHVLCTWYCIDMAAKCIPLTSIDTEESWEIINFVTLCYPSLWSYKALEIRSSPKGAGLQDLPMEGGL